MAGFYMKRNTELKLVNSLAESYTVFPEKM